MKVDLFFSADLFVYSKQKHYLCNKFNIRCLSAYIFYNMNKTRLSKIIGRKRELDKLDRITSSEQSEFVAIYGRRRVGKSFLITEYYENKFAFSVVGTYLKEKDAQTYKTTQLKHFYAQLVESGLNSETAVPTSWQQAFALLKIVLGRKRSKRKVVFIDELPWLAGPQSSEMRAELGTWWNEWASRQHNIILIVCGSATSWMLDNVINDYGGLYGRLTEKIKLLPFTMNECESFYKKHGLKLSHYEMAVAYMALGGIPYYMNMVHKELSLTQNINDIFFDNPTIDEEFRAVYAGLYNSSERYVDIVKALGDNFYGLTQKDIVDSVKIESGGTLSNMLRNLRESGVIREYQRYGKARVETVYQLIDFFSLFYLRFVGGQKHPGQWGQLQRTGQYYAWAGNTFELLCIAHERQIQDALRIKTVDQDYCYSGKTPDGIGAQIDLVMECKSERSEYLYEMKFSESTFGVSKDYEQKLNNKIAAYLNGTRHKPSNSILMILVSSFGLQNNEHSYMINDTLTLDALFEP